MAGVFFDRAALEAAGRHVKTLKTRIGTRFIHTIMAKGP
jgi:hypothetical protein